MAPDGSIMKLLSSTGRKNKLERLSLAKKLF